MISLSVIFPFLFIFSQAIACYGLSDLLNEFKLLKSIYVSRHCPRSTVDYPAQVWPPAGFPLYAQNYTSNLLFREEQWGVPAGACTEVGKLFSNKVGQSMSHSIKTPVHFIVDGESSRDNTTAQEMAKGLRTKGVNSTTEWKSIFGDSCRVPFNNDKADQSLNSRLASYPVPCNIDALLSVIQKVLKIPFGPQVNNTVFNISALPNEVKEGLYYGQIDVSATFVEDFLMERMSNLTNTQWFDLTDQELLNVLQIKNYDYNLVYGTDYTGNRMNSNLLDNILKTLLNKKTRGTTIFVGHDTNLVGLYNMLDLEVQDPYYGVNSSTPLARLGFHLYEHKTTKVKWIEVSHNSVGLDGEEMPRNLVTINGEHQNFILLQDFLIMARSRIVNSCVS